MIALDTNTLARYVLKDDLAQYRAALSLLGKRQAHTAPLSVFLELVWVLEVNDCSRQEISKGLRCILGLPNFHPPQADALAWTLRWFDEGMDFADALHLALSKDAEEFRTFDRDLIKTAARTGARPKAVAV